MFLLTKWRSSEEWCMLARCMYSQSCKSESKAGLTCSWDPRSLHFCANILHYCCAANHSNCTQNTLPCAGLAPCSRRSLQPLGKHLPGSVGLLLLIKNTIQYERLDIKCQPNVVPLGCYKGHCKAHYILQGGLVNEWWDNHTCSEGGRKTNVEKWPLYVIRDLRNNDNSCQPS